MPGLRYDPLSRNDCHLGVQSRSHDDDSSLSTTLHCDDPLTLSFPLFSVRSVLLSGPISGGFSLIGTSPLVTSSY